MKTGTSIHNSKGAEPAINLAMAGIIASGHIYLIILSVLLLIILVRVRRRRFICRHCADRIVNQEVADNRLKLLQKIIELSYKYESCPDVFHRNVCELVRISELKSHPVVDFEAYRKLRKNSPLNKDDLDFCCLLEAGFSPQALTIIYEHSNVHSVRIKKHRIEKKLKSAGAGVKDEGDAGSGDLDGDNTSK